MNAKYLISIRDLLVTLRDSESPEQYPTLFLTLVLLVILGIICAFLAHQWKTKKEIYMIHNIISPDSDVMITDSQPGGLDFETMLAYAQGSLSPKERLLVEKLVAESPFHAIALEGITEFMENEDDEALEKLRRDGINTLQMSSEINAIVSSGFSKKKTRSWSTFVHRLIFVLKTPRRFWRSLIARVTSKFKTAEQIEYAKLLKEESFISSKERAEKTKMDSLLTATMKEEERNN